MYSFVLNTQMQDLNHLIAGLKSVIDQRNVSLILASSITGAIRKRVHEEGKAADGSQIGTYTAEYMKARTGNFGNSGRFSKGKNKGEVKDSGTISRGDNKGQPRPRYNRTNDTKVVLSLTRQQENDLGVVETPTGFGIGYKNSLNFEKSQWEEETYKKSIWALTTEEQQKAVQVIEEYIKDAIR